MQQISPSCLGLQATSVPPVKWQSPSLWIHVSTSSPSESHAPANTSTIAKPCLSSHAVGHWRQWLWQSHIARLPTYHTRIVASLMGDHPGCSVLCTLLAMAHSTLQPLRLPLYSWPQPSSRPGQPVLGHPRRLLSRAGDHKDPLC